MGNIVSIRGGSGGAGLNFKIVNGTTQPTSPGENTIWVKTSTAITGYMFSSAKPDSAASGTVLIQTAATSNAAFNALKKDTLMVYPDSVSLYTDGSWAKQDAWIYQNNEWTQISWSWLYVIQNGVIVTPPGFSTFGYTGNTTLPTITAGDGYQQIVSTTNSNAVTTDSNIDLTNITTVYAEINLVKVTQSSTAKWKGISLAVLNAVGVANHNALTNAIIEQQLTTTIGEQTLSVDVSALTGSYYIGLTAPSNGTAGSTIQAKNIWLV